MTHQEFSESHDVLMLIGKFSEISATKDGDRDFLEAINAFRIAQRNGEVGEEGYIMPQLSDREGLFMPPIVEIEFIPDHYGSSDGYIAVRPATTIK